MPKTTREKGPAATLTEPVKGKGYTTGKWDGLPNYTCSSCKYATTDLEAIEAHVAGWHGGDTTAG